MKEQVKKIMPKTILRGTAMKVAIKVILIALPVAFVVNALQNPTNPSANASKKTQTNGTKRKRAINAHELPISAKRAQPDSVVARITA